MSKCTIKIKEALSTATSLQIGKITELPGTSLGIFCTNGTQDLTAIIFER